jgi:cysteine synthase A
VSSITDKIGNTPLIKLDSISKELECNVYAKCEFMNPGGSVKDRIALAMVEDAIKSEKLQNNHIVEPTSGNTGIGLAMVCAAKKIKLTIVMPESMSKERREIISHFGAELVLTDAALGMQGSIEKAKEIAQSKGALMLSQFENPANPRVHYITTGKEIADALDKNVDIFITGVGTGGTISGAGIYLKEVANTEIIAIEPEESAVISGKMKGAHKIEGIGAGFIPINLDRDLLDAIVTVKSEKAIERAAQLAKEEGLFVGISSGANIAGIYALAKKHDIKGKNIVTVLPDSASRYQSTPLFNG